MSRFSIGRMAENDEVPLEVGSWFNLYQGNGPPRTAIRCYEPKPKRAKDIKKGDVLLNQGSACRVLETPFPKDADGEIFIYVYDIFGDEMDVFITDDMEEITMCATWHTRYFVRDVPADEAVPGTLVLQKQEGLIEDNPERVFKLPGGELGPSLLPFFNTAQRYRLPITVLVYEVMGKFQLVAFGFGQWDALG